MPICPRCHGYYSREPCPTCGVQKEVRKVNVIDKSMSTSEILQKGEELVHLREENQKLRDKLVAKSKMQEELEKEASDLQKLNKQQSEEINEFMSKITKLKEENQLINAQIELLKRENVNLGQELEDLKKSPDEETI